MPSRVVPQDPLVERLRRATSISALVRFLHDELNWPVDLDAIDDAFYDYEPEELGIKPEHQVAIQSIKQLRPLTSGQPWGIFFVEFDRQKLPMVVLRRVLQGLSLRNREKDKGRQRWHARDLLFISSFGPANDREIALAHFTDETEHGDLPTLRVLGWDGADTNLALAQVATTLREHLQWPSDGDTPTGQQRWRERWSSAFRLRYRAAVTTAKDLALALAYLARAIRTRANEVLAVEGPDGPLTKLFVAFKANLMADLSHDRFADMYAQTITYGLFAARVSRSSGGLVADDAALMIPSTNPFLQELLQDFLAASGRARMASRRGRGTGIDFDELGVNAVVEQLRAAPMDAVLVSFNNARPGDDPVIHFYEDFLKAYDRAMRVERGVFYTPRPVVQFIVRSVHEVLQTEFGIEDGLASTVTWAQMQQRMPDLALPEGTNPESAFVQILDPAVGTATFLVEAVDLIHGHMRAKWQKAGLNKAQQLDAWNTYVRDHLLTRLHGFELMMAPYAIAHMKLGLKLADTGYRFPEGGPRVRVFLTNALQPASEVQPQFELMAPMLAHEARAANVVKGDLATTVVIGNPPYSRKSFNQNLFARNLVEPCKAGLENEKNIQPLQDDYIKFIQLARSIVATSGAGVVGMITNGRWLSGRIHRTLRRLVLNSSRSLRVLNLHGSGRRPAAGNTDSFCGDENVFDIQQEVAIAVLTIAPTTGQCELTYRELLGTRLHKNAQLLEQNPGRLRRLDPTDPYWLLCPSLGAESSLWECSVPLDLLFRFTSVGGKPGDDELLVHFERRAVRSAVEQRLAEFRAGRVPKKEAEQKLNRKGQEAVNGGVLMKYAYRPFDVRWTLYDSEVWTRSVSQLFEVLDGSPVLWATKICADDTFAHAFVSRQLPDVIGLSSTTSTNAYAFPLRLKAKPGAGANEPVEAVRAELFRVRDDIHRTGEPGPSEACFFYAYALLHSPSLRQQFRGFLQRDFPRIPVPGTRDTFDALVTLGCQLVQWHLLEHPTAAAITATAQPTGVHVPPWYGSDRRLAKVAEKVRTLGSLEASAEGPVGKVAINETSGFADVVQSVWEQCIGGYQVLHKWLDDRRKAGRSLSDDDIAHWRRIYAALQATQKLMLQVDEVIERHGGWPSSPGKHGAFSLDYPPPSAEVLAAQAAARPRGRRRAEQPGQQLLLEGDDEPEPAPSHPSAASPRARASDRELDDGETMCALRGALAAAAAPVPREDLARAAARALGYGRTSAKQVEALDDAIRRAARRGIAANERGALTLATRSIDDYERNVLKTQVLAVVRAERTWVRREDVPRLLARRLGFGRTGARIVEATESVLRGLVRSGDLQSKHGKVRLA